MKINKKRIAIIGGGPSGLSAAISAKLFSNSYNLNYDVVIFEKNEKIGKSILKTGNGRCNFSNQNIYSSDRNIYHNWDFVKEVQNNTLNILEDTEVFYSKEQSVALQFFDYCGIWTTKINENLYPITLKSSTVLDCLMSKINSLKINIKLNTTVVQIKKSNSRYKLITNNSEFIFDSIIICNGGINNSKIAFDFPITKKRQKFILGPIETFTKIPKILDGTKIRCKLSLSENKKTLFEEEGEVLFRKYGISGIVTFNCSRFIKSNKKQLIHIDLFPNISYKQLTSELHKRITKNYCNIEEICMGMLVSEISKSIPKLNKNFTIINFNNINEFVNMLKNLELRVKKIYSKKLCQVSRGGVSVLQLSPYLNLQNESKIFFAGEAIDVDGACGGYNLDWAWTSGILSGISAVRNLYENKN